MSEKRKKTVVVPEVVEKTAAPLIALVDLYGDGSDGRDVSKAIGFDEHGNPLYAPRGITFRIPPWS